MRDVTYCALLMCVMVLQTGCYYSQWESNEYIAASAPRNHYEAKKALVMQYSGYDACKVDDTMCIAMLLASGCHKERHGPYTAYVQFAKSCKNMKANGNKIAVRAVSVKRRDIVLWESKPLIVEMDCCETFNGFPLVSGSKRWLLPDVLDPKDGDKVQVELVLIDENSDARRVAFDFIPRVTKGKTKPFFE